LLSFGCGKEPPGGTAESTDGVSDERAEFGTAWKEASIDQRRQMVDIIKISTLFQGATKSEVNDAMGPADTMGVDKFGEDVMRYELGVMPENLGGGSYHLTIVFENDLVVNVMSNVVSLSN
jgi:hypothetical protein